MTDETDPGGTVPWRDFAAEAETRLQAVDVESPELEARWLVEEVSGIDPGEWHLRRDEPATQRGVAAFDRLLARRLEGEPIQYVLGHWAFRTLDLAVDRRVLIPRPETEVLVDIVFDELSAAGARRPTVVDLGTGSGAIALAVVREHDTAEVIATDVSEAAIAVARANTAGLGRPGARVQLTVGSWFDPLDRALRGSIDVIASNPPYISASESLPAAVVDWEPDVALVAGPRGLEHVEHLVIESREWLAPHGSVVIEMASDQTESAAELARLSGYGHVRVENDLTGRRRFVVAGLATR